MGNPKKLMKIMFHVPKDATLIAFVTYQNCPLLSLLIANSETSLVIGFPHVTSFLITKLTNMS